MKGFLVLEDGSVFEGVSIGAPGEIIGEVVLNTSVVGYQEIMTDPVMAGKILVFTYPLIGNYGAAKNFYESARCWTGAVVMKEDSRFHSNRQAETSFQDFLKKEKQIAVSGIDTRSLAVKIRENGEMAGIISTRKEPPTALLKKLKARDKNAENNFVQVTSTGKIRKINGGSDEREIAILDLGVTNSCLKQLTSLGCSIILLPYDTSAEKIMETQPQGVIISSGPENDSAIPRVADVVGELLGEIPVLGLGAGHHAISLALGGRLKKLKAGHRGANVPAKTDFHFTGKITAQNHSYVLDGDSIKDEEGLEITLRNANDGTLEEMASKRLKLISAQYNPVSPGRGEICDVFTRFLRMIDKSS